MQTNAVIYTKDNCPYCVSAKKLLQDKEIPYKEINIGRDIRRDDFVSLYPGVKSVPFIIIDGDEIGGFDKLKERLGSDS